MNKKLLRDEKIAFRNNLSKEQVEKKSKLIKENLFSLSEFRTAQKIMFYYSKGNEVGTHTMIKDALRNGKEIALPVCNKDTCIIQPLLIRDLENDLEKGNFGIHEPVKERAKSIASEDIDCIIVPGVVFDTHGARIGRGRGFYDRFLQNLKDHLIIGLAYDEQLVEKIDVDEHDIHMDIIVTDKIIVKVEKGNMDIREYGEPE